MVLNFNGNQTENDKYCQIYVLLCQMLKKFLFCFCIHSLSKVLQCEGKKLLYKNQFGYRKTKNITNANLNQ